MEIEEVGKVGINFNGNLEDKELIKRAEIAKKSGIKIIWIGEFEGFKDPFYVADIISDSADYIGFGILSPLRGCRELLKLLWDFYKVKKELIVGIAPGKFLDAKKAVDLTIECVSYLKRHLKVPVVAGCSSPIITKRSSQVADGILFNYVKPEYIRWISGFMERESFTAAYGPSLVLSSESEFYESLLIASCLVISSKSFVENFGLRAFAKEIEGLDLEKLIEIRHSIGTIKNLPEFKVLNKHSAFLLENFSISGDFEKVVERIKQLLKYCDHVVLGDPFFRDDHSMTSLRRIVREFEG
jgi:5,10-methylenetetrahydromethanopterin reductase